MADAELVQEFIVESFDLLDDIEPKLVELQHASDATGETNPEVLNSIFRNFHSMKGGAGMLQLDSITSICHVTETLFDQFRKGESRLTNATISLVFDVLDLVRKMLAQASENGSDAGFEEPVKALVAKLQTTITQKAESVPAPAEPKRAPEAPAAAAPTPSAAAPTIDIPITPEMVERFVQESYDLLDQFEQNLLELDKGAGQEAAQQAFRAIHSFKGNCGFMGLRDLETLSHKMENVLGAVKDGLVTSPADATSVLLTWIDALRDAVTSFAKGGSANLQNLAAFVDFLDDMMSQWVKAPAPKSPKEAAPATAEPPHPKPPAMISAESPGSSKSIVRQDIRVDLKKLDALINLVGELVIAEAMMTRHPLIAAHEDEGVERAVHQLRRVSRDLQDVAMSVRMIPLSSTFQKMVRLVHDLSVKSGKKVNLELLGEETEVDKTVIENIGDPLVHIVRNAIDHGIESPESRLESGKAEVGKLVIEGRHEGGEVWITITDDGKGLHRDKILTKGIEKGLVAGDGRDLTDSQVFKLIFEPGFSTAEKVTDISGRGVGMDVVKKNIEKLKGRVDVHSTPGKGTVFTLRIPLTLAIIDGMLVRVGTAKYTIPMLAIRESLRPTAEQITVTPDGQEVVKVRDELLPVIRLHRLFQKTPDFDELEKGILVILESEGKVMSLLVDEILGQQETVIKGLSNYLSAARGVSGCTILGDGEVALILDVSHVMAAGSTVSAARV